MVKSGRALRYAEGYARGLSKSPLTNQYPHKGDHEVVEGARELCPPTIGRARCTASNQASIAPGLATQPYPATQPP